MKTIAFIDAGQFRPTIVKQRFSLTAEEKFDWSKFKTVLNTVGNVDEVYDIHYFDGRTSCPTKERENFHQFLKGALNFELHFAEIRERMQTCNKCKHTEPVMEQKGVDVMIVQSMLTLAINNGY